MIATLSGLVTLTLSIQGGADLERLKKAVGEDPTPFQVSGAIPGVVMAFGERSDVLAAAKDGNTTRPMIAAGVYGKGRAACFGHGALLDQNQAHPSVTRLFLWLGAGASSDKRSKVAVFGNVPEALAAKSGLQFQKYAPNALSQAISECGTLVLGNGVLGNGVLGDGKQSISTVQRFVESGGGVLYIDTPWGWKQLNPNKEIRKDHPGQALLEPMGIGFADGILDTDSGVVKPLPAQTEHHALAATMAFLSKRDYEAPTARILSGTLMNLLSDGREGSPAAERLRTLVGIAGANTFPTKESPLKATDFRARLAVTLFDQEWRAKKASDVTAHPAAADFPGAVTAPVEAWVKVKVGGGERRWWSTGRYAAPGKKVVLRVAGTKGRVALRIGGHRDELWHLDRWQRMPSISLEVPIKDGVIEATNPFGGLIYVVANQPLAEVEVELENTAPAPTYFLGKTSDADWKRIRTSGAPWGEVVGQQCAISVPSEVLRTLDNPKALAEYWDEVVRECEKFYAVPVGTTEQRYQVDRQISAGYMHAGYPIMTGDDVSARFVDLSVLRGRSGSGLWGFYHEVGHNYQINTWTIDGWGETTNNLFSLYACKHFNGDDSTGHGAMNAGEVAKRTATVRNAPGAEPYYKKDPWFGLTFWTPIRDEFGYDKLTSLFATYAAMPASQRPRSDQERHDVLLVQMSKTLNKNLSRYFAAWGLKPSKSAISQVESLPEWLPTWLK